MTEKNSNGFKRGAFQAEVLERLKSIEKKLNDMQLWKNDYEKWRMDIHADFNILRGTSKILIILF